MDAGVFLGLTGIVLAVVGTLYARAEARKDTASNRSLANGQFLAFSKRISDLADSVDGWSDADLKSRTDELSARYITHSKLILNANNEIFSLKSALQALGEQVNPPKKSKAKTKKWKPTKRVANDP